ncbi:MAG: hypothetical protein ACXVCY_18340 [Pseudobdellovibrionaceae bacterium]
MKLFERIKRLLLSPFRLTRFFLRKEYLLAAVVIFLLGAFQNCSKLNFSRADLASSRVPASVASGIVTDATATVNNGSNSNSNSNIGVVCLDGKITTSGKCVNPWPIDNSDSNQTPDCVFPTIALKVPAKNSPETISYFSRNSGTLTECGNSINNTQCIADVAGGAVGQQGVFSPPLVIDSLPHLNHPFLECILTCPIPGGKSIAQNTVYTYYTIESGTAEECANHKIQSLCTSNGQMVPALPQGAVYNSCVIPDSTSCDPKAKPANQDISRQCATLGDSYSGIYTESTTYNCVGSSWTPIISNNSSTACTTICNSNTKPANQSNSKQCSDLLGFGYLGSYTENITYSCSGTNWVPTTTNDSGSVCVATCNPNTKPANQTTSKQCSTLGNLIGTFIETTKYDTCVGTTWMPVITNNSNIACTEVVLPTLTYLSDCPPLSPSSSKCDVGLMASGNLTNTQLNLPGATKVLIGNCGFGYPLNLIDPDLASRGGYVGSVLLSVSQYSTSNISVVGVGDSANNNKNSYVCISVMDSNNQVLKTYYKKWRITGF